MIDKKKVLAIIPARGGSKGILNKNIIDLNGKPLISYTIVAAQNSKYIDHIFVSTDSKEITKVVEAYGVYISNLRPANLSTDEAKTIDVMIDCIELLKNNNMKYDIVVLLQPTQPLRTFQDIDNALELFVTNSCQSLVSVSEVTDSPVLIRIINTKGNLENLIPNLGSTIRRQDMQKYYKVNGAIYINLHNEIQADLSLNDNKIPYIMDKAKAIDIDENLDLLIVSIILNNNG